MPAGNVIGKMWITRTLTIMKQYDVWVEDHHLVDSARDLRKNPTPEEKRLWSNLRNGALGGLKFRRQYPIGGFILDFYCITARLNIKLDGAIHQNAEQRELDQLRSAELAKSGILVLRFWNREITSDLEMVLDRIHKAAIIRINEGLAHKD